MEDAASTNDDAFPAAGLQFAAAHDASMCSQSESDPNTSVLDSQEIVVGDSGRAILVGDAVDVASDGSGGPPPPPPSKGWLRGSSRMTKGFLVLVFMLLAGFVAVLAVGVVQLSSSSSEDENQLQAEESTATPGECVIAKPTEPLYVAKAHDSRIPALAADVCEMDPALLAGLAGTPDDHLDAPDVAAGPLDASDATAGLGSLGDAV